MRKLLVLLFSACSFLVLFCFPLTAKAAVPYQECSITIVDVSATTGTYIDGSTYSLYVAEDIMDGGVVVLAKDTFIQSAVTVGGVATFRLNLPAGKVYALQTGVPEGYIKSDAKMQFNIEIGKSEYMDVMYSAVDTGVFNFSTNVTGNVTTGGTYSVEYTALGNASGKVANNLILINDLPADMKLSYVETGTYNETEHVITVYYRTNLSSDWRILGTATGGKSTTMKATQARLENNEYIVSVCISFGDAPIGFTSTGVTNPKVVAVVGDTPIDKTVTNKATLSGYCGGVKIVAPSYQQTTLVALPNTLSDNIGTTNTADGYEVIVENEEELKEEVEVIVEKQENEELENNREENRPKTGDDTPMGLYIFSIVAGGACIVTAVTIGIINKRKRVDKR